MNTDIDNTKKSLKVAFDEMIIQLQAARDAIDQQELDPVPADERNLSEGYRYLLGFLLGNIERAMNDPLYPKFMRAIQPYNKSTIDNADAVYLYTEIDGNYTYTIRGKALNSQHWRGEPAISGPRAPQYLIFELASGFAGDSGSLMELIPGTRINTDTLSSHQIVVEEDGTFEILISPEKPDGFSGNFILSKRLSEDKEHIGRYLVCRELFHDWENEQLIDLEIMRQDSEKTTKPCFDERSAIQMMNDVGTLTNNQMRFWNSFYTQLLETYGKTEIGLSGESEQPFMPINAMNEPNAMGIATGGGQSTNIYSGGIYELDNNEALIIESVVPVEPCFLGFHLSNLWGESLDFENHQSSLNPALMSMTADGVYRWVVCHRDPGVSNWLDTTGLAKGYLTLRYSYETPPAKDMWPTLKVKKVSFVEISDYLPADIVHCSKSDREKSILMRQKHVQRRYRQY